MIHVCFGLHDKSGHYSKFTGTAMLSIFENLSTPPHAICIHILHDNTLTADNRDKFSYVTGRYNQLVKFYNVEQLCASEINLLHEKLHDKINSRFSIGAFYRLLAKKILSAQDISKIIYLDSDIIVNLDIAELWHHDLGNYPLAAVPEMAATFNNMITEKFLLKVNAVKPENYFCSGILILNLDKFDEKFFYGGVQFLANYPACESVDQDILNVAFSANYLKLAQKFDSFVHGDRGLNLPVTQKIYHYAGRALAADVNDKFNRLWFKYFIRTPWLDLNTISGLVDSYRQMNIRLKSFATKVSTMMSGKTRVFFILPPNLDAIKQYFEVRNDEEIILAENNDSLNKLLDAMRNSLGKKVFFILIPNFPFGILTQAGFVIGRDFIDGIDFLSEANNLPFNSYELIKAM